MESTTRGRGRPRAGDPQKISEIALRLITERGYAETTMGDIAEAAGVSAPTLFRYFPSKAAVLWFGVEDSKRLFREACGRQPSTASLVDAVFDAYLEMLNSSAARLTVIKHRVAIVTRGRDAADAHWLQYEEWAGMVTTFVAERRGIDPTSLEVVVIGGIIWSALWSALSAWSVSDHAHPASTVDGVRRYVTVPD